MSKKLKVAVYGVVLPREDLSEKDMRLLFPRGFLNTLVRESLQKETEGLNSDVEVLKKLYEIAYGDESSWDEQVKKTFDLAKEYLRRH